MGVAKDGHDKKGQVTLLVELPIYPIYIGFYLGHFNCSVSSHSNLNGRKILISITLSYLPSSQE